MISVNNKNNSNVSNGMTEEELKKHCATYDLKIIFHTDLSFRNIIDISILRLCDNIISLNLSNNQIIDLTPLANLEKIKYLNLSKNQISKLLCLGRYSLCYIVSVCDFCIFCFLFFIYCFLYQTSTINLMCFDCKTLDYLPLKI